MKTFAAVMQVLRAKAPSGAAKHINPAIPPVTSHIVFDHLQTPSIPKHDTMQNFARSPLATSAALTAAQVDALDLVFSNDRVQRAASQLHLKRTRLFEVAGFRSAIAEAVSTTHEPTAVTPEQVVAILDRMAAEVDDEVAAVREDRARHDARHKARLERLTPLRRAVSGRVGALVSERVHCLERIDALRRAATMTDGAAQRHANLVAVGLTSEQIIGLGLVAQAPADQEAAIRARMNVIDAQIAPLRTFLADESDVTPLAGLDFEVLVNARNAAEQEPA